MAPKCSDKCLDKNESEGDGTPSEVPMWRPWRQMLRLQTPQPPGAERGPWPHLEFRHQASRTAGEYISVILGQLVCGNLSQQPQDKDKLQDKRDALKGDKHRRVRERGFLE